MGVSTLPGGNDIWFRPGAFAYCREFNLQSLGGFCRTCEYNDICRGGCTWLCFAEDSSLRDNPYCYWRQQQLAQADPPEAALPLF